MFSCAPCFHLHQYMSSKRRFENVRKHLTFMQEPPPAFKNPFHRANELIINHFNSHTQSAFSLGWASCLDKSVSVWSNLWTCPGWPLLVALMLVAHVVAQTAVDCDEVMSSTEHFIHSSTHMVADTVRVGLSIYGLQRFKRRQQMQGLTVDRNVMETI